MSKPVKILTITMWCLAAVCLVSLLGLQLVVNRRKPPAVVQTLNDGTAVTPTQSEPEIWWDAPDFSLTDQHGKAITKSDLKGHPWIADFVFTSCSSICPAISGKMASLQSKLPDDVKLVSFTVDPIHDTPEVLAGYARNFNARDGRWLFLTGPEQAQLKVIREMKVGYTPAHDGEPIIHSPHFLLVDAQGRVRGAYDSQESDQVEKLLRAVGQLEGQVASIDGGPAVKP